MQDERPFLSQTLFARSLRRHQTRFEAHVWSLVRRRQPLGLKFRRQHPIGGFVVDFNCAELRLVIELDGESHDEREAAAFDVTRTSILRTLGYRVIRLRNQDATDISLRRLIADLTFPSPDRERGQGRGG